MFHGNGHLTGSDSSTGWDGDRACCGFKVRRPSTYGTYACFRYL